MAFETPPFSLRCRDTILDIEPPNLGMMSTPMPSDRSFASRKASTIRLGAFDGTNLPLETHLAKLSNCSTYYGWSAADRVCHLKASLEGAAATLLWQLPTDCSEEQLLRLLRSRFGTADMIERFRCELRQRRRRNGESIQSVYNDVCRLVALSYPGETGELSRLVARDAFLDCLGDADMRVRVLERGATSIDEAYVIAARHETYVAAAGATTLPLNVGRTPSCDVRAVGTADYQQPTPVDQRLSALERAVSSLTNELQSWRSPTPSSTDPPHFQLSSFHRPQQFVPRQERVCYHCNRGGHIRRNCPERTSRQSMSSASGTGQVGLVTPVSSTDALLPIKIIKPGCNSKSDYISVNCILDSGASHAVLPTKYCFQDVLPTDVKLKTVSGEPLSVVGVTKAQICIGSALYHIEFVVSDAVDEILLSIGCLADLAAIWNFKEGSIEIAGQSFKLHQRQSDNCVKRIYCETNMCIEPHAMAFVPVSLKYTSLDVPACTKWLIEPKAINASLLMP